MGWMNKAREHWATSKVEVKGESGDDVERRQVEYALGLANAGDDGESGIIRESALEVHAAGEASMAEALHGEAMAMGEAVLEEVRAQEEETFAGPRGHRRRGRPRATTMGRGSADMHREEQNAAGVF